MITFIKLALLASIIFFCVTLVQVFLSKKKDKQIIAFLGNVPLFSPELHDCYVRLSGVTVKSNTTYTFYQVSGEWRDKLKKPKKGYRQAKLPIHKEIGEQSLLISAGDASIVIKPGDFERDGVSIIHTNVVTTKQCPAASRLKDQARFEKYEEKRKQLGPDESITVYGKLIKKNGTLQIIPSQHKGYPSILAIGDNNTIHAYLLKRIAQHYEGKMAAPLTIIVISAVVLAFMLR